MAKKSKKSAAKVREQLGRVQYEALKLLRKGEFTRTAISEKLNGVFVGGSMMGHVDPAKVEAGSLLARGFVKINLYPDKETGAEGPAYYELTAAGRKYLDANPTNAAPKAAPAKKKATKKAPAKKAAKKKAAKKAPAAAPASHPVPKREEAVAS